jgi:radical SAM superfamily enzyme YgiQ (UPF0313 family)
MSYVALVGPEIEENLSLRYIASSLAANGVRSEIVPFNQESDFGPAMRAILDAPERPIAVGLSLSFQWRARDFLALAVALREAGYAGHITAGGHFATFASRELLADFPEVDSICRQESELIMVELVKALQSGAPLDAIGGLALRVKDEIRVTEAPALPDLATLPLPDRRGDPAACFGHGIAPLVSSRGCYANCTFCCIAAWHEQSLPGKRYRLRDPEAVADEMLLLKKERNVDIFVFHDDNFFVPGHKRNVERFTAIADAIEARKLGEFATVVKARPTDCDEAVFRILKERLNCIRVYIGVETDADQGLRTLRRWAKSRQNKDAIDLVRKYELYTCYNMLIFDPDTTLDSIETNIRFLRYAPEYPSNFGRVELYAGTPLLARMLAEGRVRGDYMQYDYSLGSAEVERVFKLAMDAFYERNFGDSALANRIMGTRFDVEVCKHFHPELFRREWFDEGKELTRTLSLSTANGLQAIVDHVRSSAPESADAELTQKIAAELRAVEDSVRGGAKDLARTMANVLQRGAPLTDIGDRVATPLQQPRFDAGAWT